MSSVEDYDAIAVRLRHIQKARLCDCRGQFGHAHDCALFKCSVCGVICDTSPDDGPTFCPDHCPDHDYIYERGEGHRCSTCGKPRPDDWGEF